MMRTRQGAVTVALGAVVALAAAACSGSGSTGSSSSAASAATKGGTLYILNVGPHNGLDPQQSYVGSDLEFANRAYARSLVMYTAGDKPELVPDLATDTGTMTDGGKTWAFTLKGDAKWQDGKAVTCDDVKYGISRTFATDVISNGPTYILSFLDVPSDADGASVYKGPYKPNAAGDAAFNKAITCEGEKLTLHFKKPWADFNQASASLAAFSAFRKDKDKGANSLFDVFSDGPYMLQGTFDANKGGTWVRNPNWTAGDDLRKAYPDKIVDVEGLTTEVIFQRLLANGGEDQNAITFASAPSSLLAQIVSTTSAKDRTFNPTAPYVNYLTPNFQSATMKNPKIRQAFAMSTNKDAYVTANGGPQVMTPTNALCNPALACYQDSNPFGVPSAGDPVAAKKVLTDAGITTPVNITVVYRKTATSDKAYSALKQSWDAGGFNTTLEGITDKYYRTISSAASKSKDVFSASWGADWPSGSTNIPPLLDGRINITATSSNQDYGYYNDATVNKAIDATYLIPDAAAREKAWGAIDAQIVKDGGLVPLVAQKFVFVNGSKIKNFQINSLLGGYADFATIAVQ